MQQQTISRRNFVRFSVVGTGVAAAACGAHPAVAGADTVAGSSSYPQQIKIVHLSDLHYFSKSLWSDCEDFTIAENSDRKMFKESGAIIDKALAEIVAYQPDLVLVSGDLTKDGELICHTEVHDKIVAARKGLAAAGKQTLFCVINGNHDINNDDNGRDFSSGVAEHTDLVDPLAFKDLWVDCGYDAAIAKFDEGGTRGGSLSYAVRPVKGITLIAVDSGKYSSDQNGLDRDEHVTSGVVGEKLLAWVESQAKQARAAGDIVIAMQHHGVVPHFDMEPQLMGEYLADNYEECQRRYADAGISAVFTGHMHANDIASITTDAGNVLYDIETCATATYPSDIRFATLSWEREAGTATVNATLAVENHALGAVDYRDFATNGLQAIEDITAYGDEHLLSVDVVKTMIADALVSPMMDEMVSNGGVKPALAGLMGSLGVGGVTVDTLNTSLFGLLRTALPQSQDTAITMDLGDLSILIKSYGTLGIWVDGAASHIILERMDVQAQGVQTFALDPTPEAAAELEAMAAATPMAYTAGQYWSYYIDDASFAKFMATIYSKIDTEILQNGKSDTLALLRALVETLLAQQVDAEGKTLFDLIKFAYGDHLFGDETCPAWVEQATANIKLTGADEAGEAAADGSLISFLRAALNEEDNLAALTKLLKKVSLKLSDLCVKDQGSGPITLIGLVASSVGSVLGFLGENPASMIPNIPSVAELAYGALYTLTHDSNTTTDRALALGATLTDPDWVAGGAGGSDDGNGGGNSGNGGGTGNGNGTGTGSGAGSGSGSSGSTGPSSRTPGKTNGGLPQTGDANTSAPVGILGVGAFVAGVLGRKFAHDRGEDSL